jgi:preprotein translocase subunit SecY
MLIFLKYIYKLKESIENLLNLKLILKSSVECIIIISFNLWWILTIGSLRTEISIDSSKNHIQIHSKKPNKDLINDDKAI